MINEPPTENSLKVLLANGLVDVAQATIDQFKMPYRIENGELKDSLTGSELHLKRFITVDPDTVKLKAEVHKYAKCGYEVLITGETGTGKETLGRAMIGERKGKTICINCAGLPEGLIESELFGYMKGSFTGAVGDRQGLLAQAKDGVAFLDEIGELPLNVQGKLLRALQEKKVRRVGAYEEEPINCKIVCATNRKLTKMVDEGKFRQDLFARISTLELFVKPIRERTCDIVPIIQAMRSGPEFLEALEKLKVSPTSLNTRNNVRSLQQYVIRWEVLGTVKL